MAITQPTVGQSNWGPVLNTALSALDTVGPSNGYKTQTTSGAVTIDASLGTFQNVTMNGNITSWSITNGQAGQRITVQFTQDGTGSRTLAGAAGTIKFIAATAPTLTTTINRSDALHFVFDGTNWRECSARAVNVG